MSSQFAIDIFAAARPAAASKYEGATMDTIAAAWIENDKVLSGTYPGSECARRVRALAVYDVLKAEARKHGISDVGAYVARWGTN